MKNNSSAPPASASPFSKKHSPENFEFMWICLIKLRRFPLREICIYLRKLVANFLKYIIFPLKK